MAELDCVSVLDQPAVTYLHAGPFHFKINYVDERQGCRWEAVYTIDWQVLHEMAQMASVSGGRAKSGALRVALRRL